MSKLHFGNRLTRNSLKQGSSEGISQRSAQEGSIDPTTGLCYTGFMYPLFTRLHVQSRANMEALNMAKKKLSIEYCVA